jgi:hypothetical protein
MKKRLRIDTIVSRFRQDLVKQLDRDFTGDLSVIVSCNQGGIRGAKVTMLERMDDGKFLRENTI